MSIITTGSIPAGLWPGVNSFFGMGYKEHPTLWDKMVQVETSKKNYEVDYLLTGMGLPKVKPEGSGIAYDSMKQNWKAVYQHIVYALGMIVTREEIDDDLYDNVSKKRAYALGRAFRLNKEIIVANLYNNAFSSGVTYGDGVSLINASHPLSTGGTVSNQPSAATNINETALEQAVTDITLFVDDRGQRIMAMPDKLIIHPQSRFDVHRILKSELQNDTADNAVNALKALGYFSDVIVNPFLTSTKAWFITTDIPDGIKLFQRDGLEFAQDNDFETENAKFKARERFSVGASDTPRCIYGSAGV